MRGASLPAPDLTGDAFGFPFGMKSSHLAFMTLQEVPSTTDVFALFNTSAVLSEPFSTNTI